MLIETVYSNHDIFVSKFDSSLENLLASTFIGGSDYDYLEALYVDSSGAVFVAGYTYSSDFPTTVGAYDTTLNGSLNDVFVSKFDSNLENLLASTFIGTANHGEIATSLSLGSSGDVYVAGYTGSSDFPTTVGAYDTTYNGGNYDIFVSRLNNDLENLLASTLIGGSDDDIARSLCLDSSGAVYVAGYTHSSDFPTTEGTYNTSSSPSNCFVSKLDSNLDTTSATVTGTLTLPSDANGTEYFVIIDNDTDGDNGYIAATSDTCGPGTTVDYPISNVPAGTYYIYACVRIVSTHDSPPESDDFFGFYGTGNSVPTEPNAVIPSSGTVSFDITLGIMDSSSGIDDVGDNDDGSSGCFIATMAYASPMAHNVKILRDFIDVSLLRNRPGRLFARFYYK
ncbi:MAG: SBBP repeat-containing protein [Thermodesulfobacteriota bacterium]|nr:SBBP repeat-containing protein [Thermodesulfobacteriota bacterium]